MHRAKGNAAHENKASPCHHVPGKWLRWCHRSSDLHNRSQTIVFYVFIATVLVAYACLAELVHPAFRPLTFAPSPFPLCCDARRGVACAWRPWLVCAAEGHAHIHALDT